MTEQQDLRSRLVRGRKRDGRREFNEDALDELVELCLKPGVSVARTAMEHDVNPNQLRKWITRYQQRQVNELQQGRQRACHVDLVDGVALEIESAVSEQEPSACAMVSVPPAFVPVVAAAAVQPALPPTPSAGITSLLVLHVRLPNGVAFDLGEAGVDELAAVIGTLGRLPCSGSTKA